MRITAHSKKMVFTACPCEFVLEMPHRASNAGGESGGGVGGVGQRIRSRLCADSREPDMGLELTNHETTA